MQAIKQNDGKMADGTPSSHSLKKREKMFGEEIKEQENKETRINKQKLEMSKTE